MRFEILADSENEFRKRYRSITSSSMMVELSTFGAAIQNIALRDERGWRSIVLSYPSEDALCASGSYAGRTLAPNAGRIRGGALDICGRKHSLAPNDGQNQLHGGKHNLSFTDWAVEELEEAPDYVKIGFTATQPDGLDGFPGNRRYHVRYIIEDTSWIRIEYRAESDQPTYVNLSNHTYWNLAGSKWIPEDVYQWRPLSEGRVTDGGMDLRHMFEDAETEAGAGLRMSEGAETAVGAGLCQELEITANNVVLNDAASLPADLIPVAGTPFDFRVPVTLQHMLDSEILRDRTSTEQFQTGRGFNNAYVLTRADLRRHLRGVRHEEPLKKACTLRDPVSGHQMTMMTDATALVLYSGGFLPTPGSHIALEAQDIPDVSNLLPERMTLTTPETPFHREIRFKIS